MTDCKHRQLLDMDNQPVLCEECGGKICDKCGRCYDCDKVYLIRPTARQLEAQKRFRCSTCSIFVKKPLAVPPGKDCVVTCTREHKVTYHSPATWIVQAFRDPVTGIEGNDTNEGLSTMKPLKTISEALRRATHPDVITVANPDLGG